MPIYTYKARNGADSCGYCVGGFETIQKITEDALEVCPDCGNEIVRIMHAAVHRRDDSNKAILSDENLKKHGFKKLVNAGGGKFDEVV